MDLLSASCRVALAGLCHDLGKFAQRAQEVSSQTDKNTHIQLYCPRTPEGYHTHIHAAFTALAFGVIEKIAPPIASGDLFPFESRDSLSKATDSLINCCAAHHYPQTFLQWIVATADRVASGFERETFDKYNTAPENDDFYSARLLTLFEQIRFSDTIRTPAPFKFAYPLAPLSVSALYPKSIAPMGRSQAVEEYKRLWTEFKNSVESQDSNTSAIRQHNSNWSLWLDHFDTLWLTFTHSIPSATAFGAKPDVSLYDHSKATAAFATALWRWHYAAKQTGNEAASLLQSRRDWDTQKFLVIQGDCFGIQDFIFSDGSNTNKKAAKILRGRSFYVSLLSELAALRVLEELQLPSTSQVINAAGKFLIVAPNTPDVIEKLIRVQKEINDWFVRNTFAVSGLGLCWEAASCNDFIGGRFADLQQNLFAAMEKLKHQRYGLCNKDCPVVLEADYANGACNWNNRYPADRNDNGESSCALSRDQIHIGEWLTKATHIQIVSAEADVPAGAKACELPIFGYRVVFSENRVESTHSQALNGELIRMWDITMPSTESEVLWHGCARRNISGYVPRFSQNDTHKFDTGVYDSNAVADGKPDSADPYRLKSFSQLACEDRLIDANHSVCGVSALAILKGDVDNLGRIFSEGLASSASGDGKRQMTFAKMATLSRQMNNFFSMAVPLLNQSRYPNIYTVFAGGDDFFFIGPWRSTQRFLSALQTEFERYVTGNPLVHFSAGVSVCKPNTSVSTMSRFAEDALEHSKSFPDKNAVTIYSHSVHWPAWAELQECSQHLERLQETYQLSTSYLYGLFELIDLSDKEAADPAASLWRSRFRYRTARFADDVARKGCGERSVVINGLSDEIYRYIDRHRGNYRIALTNFFYTRRQ